MIAYLEGLLVEVHSDRIVVDVGGVGYEILVPYFVKRSFDEKLARSAGQPPKVKVVTLYRVSPQNPKPELIGFETVDERIFFEKLLTVSGIGAAKAAKALVYSVSTIAKFIEDNNVDQLARLPGFGRRTAEKVIAELRGKVLKEALLADERFADLPALDQEIDHEAIEVLRRLGFTQVEAKAAVQAARKRSGPIESAEDLVQAALRVHARGNERGHRDGA
jgi:Holliday junction DNA helicase RuvA